MAKAGFTGNCRRVKLDGRSLSEGVNDIVGKKNCSPLREPVAITVSRHFSIQCQERDCGRLSVVNQFLVGEYVVVFLQIEENFKTPLDNT